MSKAVRRYDLDWFRIVGVLLVMLDHTGKFTDIFEGFYVVDDHLSVGLSVWYLMPINCLPLPALFFVSGAATWYSLGIGNRSVRRFLRERVDRLVVPFLFGLFTVLPIMGYVGQLKLPDPILSPIAYYPHFFHLDMVNDPQGYQGSFSPGHLWYILYLVVFSLAIVPLCLWMRGGWGQRVLGFARTAVLGGRWPVQLLVLPAIAAASGNFLLTIGGKSFLYYFFFFLFGYGMIGDERFEEACRRLRVPALVLTIASLVFSSASNMPDVDPERWHRIAAYFAYRGFASWAFIIAFLGFGQDLIRTKGPALDFTSEIAYPFYIFHLPVMVAVAYWVFPLDLPLAVTVAILIVTTTVGATALSVGLGRFRTMRFLLGMHLTPKTDVLKR